MSARAEDDRWLGRASDAGPGSVGGRIVRLRAITNAAALEPRPHGIQVARSATHELLLTPLAENWTP